MNQMRSRPDTQISRYEALAACDALRTIGPASLLIESRPAELPHLLAIGTPNEVSSDPAAAYATVHRLPTSVLLPGLVNAHTHLDLTDIGPQPFDPDRGFAAWADMVRTRRPTSEDAIRSAVRRGIQLSLTGGVVAVGDIAGAPAGQPSLTPFQTLRDSPLWGVSFAEFFGIGRHYPATLGRLPRLVETLAELNSPNANLRAGIQPHAPNTVDLRVYDLAVRLAAGRGLPISTHLAESDEERRFVSEGTGPQRSLLEGLGIWDGSVTEVIGRGLDPVEHLASVLAITPMLVAHVNDCDDRALGTLARTGTRVAYCPRASAYFGAERHFGPHRYREMLAAGIGVCLGTDSVINLPNADRISVLDDMRFLYHRDRTDPHQLVRMATLNGAAALGLDRSGFTFEPGVRLAGLIAVDIGAGVSDDPLASVLLSASAPRLLVGAQGRGD
jgi:cytosine/adenosine deaminase-related metal-dependent hydrolase